MTSNNKGFTLMELLIVVSIIGVLATIALPSFSQYRSRAMDADAKSNLHNIYLACKVYWSDNGSNNDCSVTAARSTAYGYTQSKDVTIIVTAGAENNFSSNASHIDSNKTYTINAAGGIA